MVTIEAPVVRRPLFGFQSYTPAPTRGHTHVGFQTALRGAKDISQMDLFGTW